MDYVEKLKEIVGEENVFTDEVELISYSRDMSVHQAKPDVVVYALNRDHIVEIMKLATAEKIPVTPRAAGTSVTGAAIPVYGGIVLNISKLNKVLEINKPNGYVICQPGVICNDLNKELGSDYFFPPDPGSSDICSLGGMVSLNASGVRAMKYGTTKDFVMGMEVVLPDGRVLRCGRKAPKSSTGYDLTMLFTTAEGTLGIITELTLKIIPTPDYTEIVTAAFSTLESNGDAVTDILTSGIELSTCEIMDRMSIQTVNDAKGMDLPDVETYLIMEIDGHKQAVKDQVKKVVEICKKHGAASVDWTDDPGKRMAMWAGRSVLVPSLSRWKTRYRLIPIMEDMGVPISAIPKAIREIQDLPEKYGIKVATFGHVGDGNLHATFVGDPTDPKQWEGVRGLSEELMEITMKYEGTISAEHGIGISKSPFILKERGEVSHQVMLDIKKAIDPHNIMNPGKMGFDESMNDIFSTWAFDEIAKGQKFAQSFGDEIDNEILVCVQCGFCRSGCPVFKQTGKESTIARGRVQQAYSMLTGRDVPEDQVADAFYTCTMCGLCQTMCPSGIQSCNVVQKVRGHMGEKGFLPVPHRAALDSIRANGNPFEESPDRRTDLYPDSYTPSDDPEVLLFLGCVASYQDLNLASAVMGILDRAGVKYTTMGEEENCCGFLNYLIGDDGTDVMNKTASLINATGINRIVATCAGCYRTLHDIYPKTMDDWDHQVQHAIEFLLEIAKEGKLNMDSFPKKVAYHDPCDLGRHMKMFDPPRELLKTVPDLELVEFADNRDKSMCCGGGGGLKGYANEMSQDIAYERIKQAADVGAEVVVSGCPTCKDNLALAAKRLKKETGNRIKVMDIVELFDKIVKS